MWAAIKSIITAIQSAKWLIEWATKLYAYIQQKQTEKKVDEAKKKVDEVVGDSTKDQTPIEKAIGSDNAGKPNKKKLDDMESISLDDWLGKKKPDEDDNDPSDPPPAA